MKKLIAILLAVAVALPMNIHAGPMLIGLVYEGISDFAQLRYRAENYTDEQLQKLIHARQQYGYYNLYHRVGITNREELQKFISDISGARIPVLPDPEETKLEIDVNHSVWMDVDRWDFLQVWHQFSEDATIEFWSFYTPYYDGMIDWVCYAMDAPPTLEKDGIRYYYLLCGGLKEFMIFVDGYVILANFRQYRWEQELSPEEKLEKLQRFSFERLGGEELDEPPPQREIELTIGSRDAYVNGVRKTLDAAPFIDAGNRTMIPLRFIAEALGGVVQWNPYTETITIIFDE